MKLLKKLTIGMLLSLFAVPALAANGKVNINEADAGTLLRQLDSLSQSQAEAIIEYRDQNGPYVGLYELDFVEGIDRDFFLKNQGRMEVGNVSLADKKS